MPENKLNVQMVEIDLVIPYARNPRKNDKAIAKVAGSIKEFGWQQPIVVDAEMTVIVGHTRLEAARQLGATRVPVYIAKHLTPEQVKAYRIGDNRSGEEATWDEGLLKLELMDMKNAGYELQNTGMEMAAIELALNPVESTRPDRPVSMARAALEADPNKILIGKRRIDITPEDLQGGLTRVTEYIEANGTLYGFVADMLGIEVIE